MAEPVHAAAKRALGLDSQDQLAAPGAEESIDTIDKDREGNTSNKDTDEVSIELLEGSSNEPPDMTSDDANNKNLSTQKNGAPGPTTEYYIADIEEEEVEDRGEEQGKTGR